MCGYQGTIKSENVGVPLTVKYSPSYFPQQDKNPCPSNIVRTVDCSSPFKRPTCVLRAEACERAGRPCKAGGMDL